MDIATLSLIATSVLTIYGAVLKALPSDKAKKLITWSKKIKPLFIILELLANSSGLGEKKNGRPL